MEMGSDEPLEDFTDTIRDKKKKIWLLAVIVALVVIFGFFFAILPSRLPSPPLNLEAVPGDGFVSLSWVLPLSDGWSPIMHFNIYRGTTQENLSLTNVTVSGIPSFIDDDVVNGITYYYQVSATNKFGDGQLSNEIWATPESP